jgi:uncharacterized glyoxalase superfamily protein PhnB
MVKGAWTSPAGGQVAMEDHFGQAAANGAAIIEPLGFPWGLALYVAADLEGNRWTFAHARPAMQ